jgi:Flp pilus assembly pilin Flp
MLLSLMRIECLRSARVNSGVRPYDLTIDKVFSPDRVSLTYTVAGIIEVNLRRIAMTELLQIGHLKSESGAALVEYVLLLLVASVILIAILSLFFGFHVPEVNDKTILNDKAILIAGLTALLGAMAWAGKEALSAMYRRIQFLILEYLSDNAPHSREEIQKALGKRVLSSVYLDALKDLVLEGKVVVEKGKYKLPKIKK